MIHLIHGARIFERDTAGIERNALADQNNRRARGARRFVFDHDELGRFVAAAGDGEETAHFLGANLSLIEDSHLDAIVTDRQCQRLLGEVARRADVTGQIGEIPHQLGTVGRCEAVHDAAPRGCSGRGTDASELDGFESGRRRLLSRLQIVDSVQR